MRSYGKSLRQAALVLNTLGEGGDEVIATQSKTTARNFWSKIEYLNNQGPYPQRLKYDTGIETIINEETLGTVKFLYLDDKKPELQRDNSKAYSIIAAIVIAVFIGGLINAG